MGKIFLLADDDSDDADLFQEVLSEIDPALTFYRAWDGNEVFEKLESKNLERPDIIFLDINMPGMNGWQCLAKLKNSKEHKDIPVFIYSTSSHKRDAEIALDLSALCFITKPDDFHNLKRILELIVRGLDQNLSAALEEISNMKELKCTCAGGRKELSARPGRN